MIKTEAKTRVPSFATIEEVKEAQRAKKERRRGKDLYFRDGSLVLTDFEREVANIVGIKEDHLFFYGTGMAAVGDVLEINYPTVGTRIVRGTQHYSQAGRIISIDFGEKRGVSVFTTNQGSIPDIERTLKKRQPHIVFFETVTNGSEMATLDIDEFLRLPILEELDPVIILDNTLPTSAGLPLEPIMAASKRRIIGVESGTKYIGLNVEQCGFAYTYNTDLLRALGERRQRWGSLLSQSAIETIRECMPKTAEEYNARNGAIFKHTLRLARACAASAGNEEEFVVVHPNLPSHPNNSFANSYAPDGISPVFFMIPTDLGEESHYQIGDKLGKHPVIQGLRIGFGQSFGFDDTRIWPDDNAPIVRVSGGIYSEAEQAELDQAFSEVLSNLK